MESPVLDDKIEAANETEKLREHNDNNQSQYGSIGAEEKASLERGISYGTCTQGLTVLNSIIIGIFSIN